MKRLADVPVIDSGSAARLLGAHKLKPQLDAILNSENGLAQPENSATVTPAPARRKAPAARPQMSV